ncbi:MAG: hypothetical protein NT125_06985, partial [Candidatus Bipolaricaulota bacterium]|nr:hypothetical protein [Candidatus Bipolaricaulota bacterium]
MIEDPRKPLAPFHELDLEVDPHAFEQVGDDLARADVDLVVLREGQGCREAVRITGVGEEPSRLVDVVRVEPRQIHVVGTRRREVASDRDSVAEHRSLDDHGAVERVRDRLPHFEVGEGGARLVHGEELDEVLRPSDRLEARVVLDREGGLGRDAGDQ